MIIRHSEARDFDRMMEIYAHARQFMADHGNPLQWGPTNWPPAELLKQDIESGKSYVCEEDGRVIGTFYFDQGKDIDPTYLKIEDGQWMDDSAYGVVHRLASDGSVKGTGAFCLGWAFLQCGHMRVDTHGDNTVMQNLLEKLGYKRTGTIYVVEDPYPRFAYEKVLEKRTAAKNETSIVFTGDIGFDRYMEGRWADENLLDECVLDFFHSADHVVANVEGAVMEAEDDGSRGTFFHAMNPAAVDVLNRMHADIWSIGNNHTMDAGLEGLLSTKRHAAENHVRTIGGGININEASEPVYLDGAGGIGMFCVAYQAECIPAAETEPGTFRWDDMERIAERIAEIKKTCRWCVIVSHGGEEFTPLAMPYTRDRYLKYLELGADAVVGHHPHVPENYEFFEDGKAIFYSLGNFIFDTDYQRVHRYTDHGVLLKLIFTEDMMDFDAMGIRIVRGEERIKRVPLPDIFTDVPAEEYELLVPLAAKAFEAEERRKMIYLEPERFADASEDVWNDYFFSEEPDGFFRDAHMDFHHIIPLAAEAENGDWKKSRLEEVKQYIQELL